MNLPQASLRRQRLLVRGTVQGVGFRPFVYRVATEEALAGGVRNVGWGVVIELQGPAERLTRFRERLVSELRPPGRIDRLEVEERPPRPGVDAVVIEASEASSGARASLAPDGATCPDCLAELADSEDRRFRYPFVNCTACGPRYTITAELPYDRANTTMRGFPLCDDCRREYEDPLDRRYHAEPVACPRCGPRVWLARVADGGTDPPPFAGDPAAALDAARALLRAGSVVALKGLGGFHLAADARSEAAVARLRRDKRRQRKPLALMVRGLDVAHRILRLDAADEALLRSPEAPVVVAPARPEHGVAASVAPGIDDLGVMLPYTPLHHLLFGADLDALVMTSGNDPAEPITTDDALALETLPADAWLLHDRPIEVACDDSVVRTGPRGPVLLRRARGYVPRGLPASCLPDRQVLALGAQLKVTLATVAGGELVVGRHLGDLDNPAAEAAFVAEVGRMLAFGGVEPDVVAVYLHPDLYTTLHAEQHPAQWPLVRVQHHHAHLAAVALEHGIGCDERVVGVVLDGVGYGPDGTVWGGEVLVGGYRQYERVGHLRPVPLPGGDRAAREPGRMATSLLWDAGLGGPERIGWDERVASICGVSSVSPRTSSAGRLFDGVAALLGLAPDEQDYEGEAALRLEAAADPACRDGYPLPATDGVLDVRALVAALLDDDAPVPRRAARFHNGLADGLAAVARATGLETVVLAGGCLANRRLTARLVERLGGLRVLLPRALPAGDGGLAAGQAAVAACSEEA